ncbi:MAG: molybdopterin-binding protein [Flavobacterium sp.]|nr:MAG: molybdopterin-binding protein [Flavobacterium sp.]
MRYLSLILLVFCISAAAQVTSTITVGGAITKPYTLKFDDLKAMKAISLDSLPIYNHKMEPKNALKKLKGVLLKDVLDKAEFSVKSPKTLSEFYIVCIADDGYKVVYSWNELFNSETGNRTLVITEIDGSSVMNQKEGIRLVTPTDKATGRRYVKNLSKIRIEKVK